MTTDDVINELIDFKEEGRLDNAPLVLSKLEARILMKEYHKRKLKLLGIANVVGRSEQLVCDCGNKLTDKELYFGQCLQCDKNVEEAN